VPEGRERDSVTDLRRKYLVQSPASTWSSAWRAHSLYFGLVFAYLLLLKLASALYPSPADQSGWALGLGLLLFSIPFAVVAIIMREFYEMLCNDKPASPIRRLGQRLTLFFTDQVKLQQGIPMFAAMLLFMFAFTLFKAKITAFVPFQWDATFDALDKQIHFGTRPWEWLHPIFGNVFGTFILNLNYNIWFVVMNLFWVHFAFYAKPGEQRTRFFLTYMLCWMVGGSVMATLFSSAGPCYFALIGNDPQAYAGALAHMKSVNAIVPVWALDAQDMLWTEMKNGSAFGGISAMPSMHNATSLLFVMMTWKGPRLLRNLMIAHAAMILLGSVHLAWHYAVDAYAAYALLILVWFATKPLARWWENRKTVVQFAGDYAHV
jgi:hypothetical protein